MRFRLLRLLILLVTVITAQTIAQASELIPIDIDVKDSSDQYIATYCPDNTCDLMTFKKKHFDKTQASNIFSLYLLNFSGYVYLEDLAKKNDVQKVNVKLISDLKIRSVQKRLL